jgi:hypothetical protein
MGKLKFCIMQGHFVAVEEIEIQGAGRIAGMVLGATRSDLFRLKSMKQLKGCQGCPDFGHGI